MSDKRARMYVLQTWVPGRGVDAAAAPEQGADEPRADVAGSPRHAHRRRAVLFRRESSTGGAAAHISIALSSAPMLIAER